MSPSKLCAVSMVRNEPFAVYGVLSIINYISKIIIIDTGSTDGTFSELEILQQRFKSKIILEQRKLEDGHNWNINDTHVDSSGVPPHVSKALGDIRRELHARAESEWVLTLDGDEVWPETLIDHVRSVVYQNGCGTNAIFLPFMDFIDDHTMIRQLHYMGRVYRKDITDIRGNFPYEMHHNKVTGHCYETNSYDAFTVKPQHGFVNHFECLLKPFRKKHTIVASNDNPLPQVIYDNLEKFPRIKPYIEKKYIEEP